MFEEFNAKYEDFCWFEITNELSKNNIEKQAKQGTIDGKDNSR